MKNIKPLQFQKIVQYNTILEDEICFSESMTSIIQKFGNPDSTDSSDNQITLEYKRNLHTFILTVCYCFYQDKLCSVYYVTDALADDISKHFLSDMKRLIREKPFDSVMNYMCCNKEYWELSDGVASMHICLCAEKNKAYIRIDYFD